jgi:3-hydroxyacyl-CoA dehydrogenase
MLPSNGGGLQALPPDVIIASSSSGLKMSDIQLGALSRPARLEQTRVAGALRARTERELRIP